MRLSKRLADEKAFVERRLGNAVICPRCRATLATYSDHCSAELWEMCPGFEAIENAKREFALEAER